MTARDRDKRRLPASECPYCDNVLDAASPITGEATPVPGDLTICLYCAQELVFDAALVHRRPWVGELEAMYGRDPAFAREVRRLKRLIRDFDRTGIGKSR